MGRDKALLTLGGKLLIEHAVTKLRRVCRDVAILSADPELEGFAPLVVDVHPACGPMSGMEAALLATRFDWNLFLPVDVPFLPTSYLVSWIGVILREAAAGVRVAMFTVEGVAQPTLALVHRGVLPFLTASLEAGRYKLQPVLAEAAAAVAERDGLPAWRGLWKIPYWREFTSTPGPQHTKLPWCYTTEAQRAASGRWFSNLNAPEEFAEAERHVDALDT